MAVFCCFHQDISTMNDTFPAQDTPPSSSKRRGRHCAAFSCGNSYYDAKGNPTCRSAFLLVSEGRPAAKQMVQSHEAPAWKGRILRHRINFFVLGTFQIRRHPKNVGRSLRIGERLVIFVRLFCCCLDTERKCLF